MLNMKKLIQKIIFSLGLIMTAGMILSGCGDEKIRENSENIESMSNSGNSQSAGFTMISAEEAYERMNSNDPIIILDVRRADEYETGHIKDAILLSNEDISDTKPDTLPDVDAEILVYCRSGRRSKQAAQKLVDLGYTNVYEFGGIIDWPYETVVDGE